MEAVDKCMPQITFYVTWLWQHHADGLLAGLRKLFTIDGEIRGGKYNALLKICFSVKLSRDWDRG